MSEADAAMLRAIGGLVGNTPLLAIEALVAGRRRVVYAKAEHLNLTGSIKDRMALHVVRRAYERGLLRPGRPIVEATSGNTGIALAAVGRALGHPVTIFMPDWMSQERVALLESLGAELRLVSREEGGFLTCIERAKAEAAEQGGWHADQFANADNAACHEASTGPEIVAQLKQVGVTPAAFVAGVGTGGTVMGVGRFLRSHFPGIRVHPVQPSNSPTLTAGRKVGKHRIQGISDDFVPDLIRFEELDSVLSVDDGDAIRLAQALARDLGLGVGISSGANLAAAFLAAQETDGAVVTVFADDNKKYLSTDLLREEPVKPGFVSSTVELLGYRTLERAFAPDWNAGEAGGILVLARQT